MENYRNLMYSLSSVLAEAEQNANMIDAVKSYVSASNYVDVDVVLALLGIEKRGNNDD